MVLEYGGIRVIDSLNFLPMPLSALPKAFGEQELKKGYFPHKYVFLRLSQIKKINFSCFRFNIEANANYKGPWPDAYFYSPGTMKPEQREAFYSWYQKQTGKEFDFREEILSYCESDTEILARCCMKFEELFHQVIKNSRLT